MIGNISTKLIKVLFTPHTPGDLQVKNRIVMAPANRTRAEG
jgi:2,4-dienoyl-CoA reductase-like NADH-dependent reductase (Old Yellow Enzyme family)